MNPLEKATRILGKEIGARYTESAVPIEGTGFSVWCNFQGRFLVAGSMCAEHQQLTMIPDHFA
jgi:hypothetical protein